MSKRFIHTGSQIVDVSTGELVAIEEIGDAINVKIADQFKDNIEELAKLGLDSQYRLIRARDGESHHCINVKEDYEFTKMFKVDVRNMLNTIGLSVHAKAFMYDALANLYFPTNTIIVKGENPSIEQLCKMIGVKDSKMYQILKELEDKDIIKRIKRNGSLVIYLNPFLHSCGLVDSNTYEMFKDSNYNPLNTDIK